LDNLGRGIATLKVDKLKIIKELRAQKSLADEDPTPKLKHYFKEHLSLKLKLACPAFYPRGTKEYLVFPLNRKPS
jgi:hypothetical protein